MALLKFTWYFFLTIMVGIWAMPGFLVIAGILHRSLS